MAPAYERLRIDDEGPVRRITLSRPDVHNAFDERAIEEITRAFDEASVSPSTRVIVLTGEGRSFCAGADLAWMRRMAGYDEAENLADARRLARMLETVDRSPKAVLARVNGAAFGGACGLLACSDRVVAVERARFAFTEVRLGLVPSTIAPFVARKIGPSAARDLLLTGRRFDAAEARRIGLVHTVVSETDLDAATRAAVDDALAAAPEALARTKRLLRDLAGPLGTSGDDAIAAHTARLIADVRAGEEAGAGIAAFFEKRNPPWTVDPS